MTLKCWFQLIEDVCTGQIFPIHLPIKIVDIKFQDIVENGWVDRDKVNVVLSGQLTLTNGLERYFKMNVGNVIYMDDSFGKQGSINQLMQYPYILKSSGYDW